MRTRVRPLSKLFSERGTRLEEAFDWRDIVNTFKNETDLEGAFGMGKNQSKALTNAELQEDLQIMCKPAEKYYTHEIRSPLHSGSAFDRERFLANMGDDPEFIREICELFMSCYPEVMIQLREAIHDSHATRSQAAAHQLKGMVANFAAQPAVELLRKIEELAKNGELQSIQQLYYDLELQMSRLKVALAGVILKPSSAAIQSAPRDEKIT